MPSVIDQARDAGFSDDEIQGWASGQIPTWKQAGFSDEEIGTFVTGLKRPGKVPSSLVDRLMSTTSDVAGRIGGAFSEMSGTAPRASQEIAEAPLAREWGPSKEDIEKLRGWGLYMQPGETIGTTTPLKFYATTQVELATRAAQAFFRVPEEAIDEAGRRLGGAYSRLAGETPEERERSRAQAAEFAGIAAVVATGDVPITNEAGILGNGRVVDNIIGRQPKISDFTDATRIITDGQSAGGSIRDKLIKLYENRGILPAEVATDAAKDPVLKEQLADPQAPLPPKYGGAQMPAEEVAAKVEKIEGASPAPSILDDIYGKLRTVGVSEEIAQHQAAIPAAMFEQWGRRLGVDPMELYAREGFDVRRDLPGVSDIPEGATPEEAQRIFEQRRMAPPQPNLFTEREAEGQMQIPGAERISDAELAQRRAQEPLKPSVEQKPMDIGLFSEGGKQKELFQFPAYHGSPHDFERFDISRVGTGEGAQSYGHGLYFAEREEVARDYHAKLTGRDVDYYNDAAAKVGGESYDRSNPLHEAARDIFDAGGGEKGRRTAIGDYEASELLSDASPPGYGAGAKAMARQVLALLKSDQPIPEFKPPAGAIYRVRINAEKTEFLDWDKPLKDQPAILAKMREAVNPDIREAFDANVEHGISGANAYHNYIGGGRGGQAASESLRDIGIPGIKYLDQGSRAIDLPDDLLSRMEDVRQAKDRIAGLPEERRTKQLYDRYNELDRELERLNKEAEAYRASQRTHNYVLFDDSLIEITHKNGEMVTAAERAEALREMYQRGETAPNPRGRITLGQNKTVIDLFATADRSTFLHETGHMWLDQLVRFAQEVPQGHEIRADLQTVMDWLGVRSPEDIGVAEHERFARGFEQYLRDGEAPSSRLAAAFDKFRQWLAAIYRQLTALGEPLSAEVRGVMRRALASPAEIEAWTKHQEALAKGQVPSEIAVPEAAQPRGEPEAPGVAPTTPPVPEMLPETTAGAPEGGPEAGTVSRETVPAPPSTPIGHEESSVFDSQLRRYGYSDQQLSQMTPEQKAASRASMRMIETELSFSRTGVSDPGGWAEAIDRAREIEEYRRSGDFVKPEHEPQWEKDPFAPRDIFAKDVTEEADELLEWAKSEGLSVHELVDEVKKGIREGRDLTFEKGHFVLDALNHIERTHGLAVTSTAEAYGLRAPTPVKPRQLWGPASRPQETWSLLEYLANRGGLRPSGDLSTLIGRGQKPVPGFGMLIRRAGMTMDEALQAAKDGGYLIDAAEKEGHEATLGHNDLYELMDRELRGQKQYRVGYQPETAVDPLELQQRIAEHLDGELEKVDVDPRSVDAGLRARIAEIMTRERVSDPLVAYEQAVMEEINRGTETGQAERIPDHIPGWDVAHESGTMEPAGGFARRLAASAEPEARGAGAESGETGGGASARGAGRPDLRGPAGGAIGGRPASEPGLRDPLGTPRSFDQAGLPPDPNAKPYFTYDQRGTAKKIFDRIILGWKNTFQPEIISDAARALDPIIAAYKSRQAMGHDQVWTLMEEDHQYWRTQTPEQRAIYLNAVERGVAENTPIEWRQQASSHRELLDLAYQLERRAGSKAAYVEEYLPHLFEDPEQFRNFVKLKINTLGPTWFQKPRAFDFIQDAKDAGLRLKTDNPADLVAHRLIASVDMVERMSLLRDMQGINMAVPTKQIRIGVANEAGTLFEMPTETVHYISPQDAPGWQEIIAPNREKWMIAPDAQALWKNGVEAKGLWANEGAIGSAFRGWMALKNVWVPIKLAFSAFHPLHVMHIEQTQYLAAAYTALVKGGDPIAAMKNVGEALWSYPAGLYSIAAEYARPLGVPRIGHAAEGAALREAWLTPEAERTPLQRAQIGLFNDGGFVPQLSEQLKIAAKRGLEDAIDNNKPVKFAFMGAKRLLEFMQAPIFERWIPSLKAAAYMREATALLQRNPELFENDVLRRAALRTIGKSIDNRFGEMFYGTLFWNRYVKDTGIGSFLSLGWNLGFAREFGGAAIEMPLARPIERLVKGPPSDVAKVQREASSKVPFVTSYVASAALTMGLMSYLFTGETPSGYDWFLPRIGGTNPDGSPRRITNMTYLREVPMLLKHIQEQGGNVAAGTADMLYNKLIIQPMVELAKNASYYGYEIYDSAAPFWKQTYQAAKHLLGEQFDPMSAAGYRRAIQNGWSPWEASLAYLGFGPAPAYAERTATQNRIYYLYRRFVSPEVRPYELGETGKERQDIRAEIVKARDSGDHPALEAAAQKWFKAGGSRQGLNNIMLNTPGDIALFKALPEPAQRAVLDQATPEEKTRYLPSYKHNTARKVADLAVAGEQARLAGNQNAASQAEAQINDLVKEAVTNGWITDANAFRRAVAQEVVARCLPEVSAILSLPKAKRGQAAPRLLGPSAGAQPMNP